MPNDQGIGQKNHFSWNHQSCADPGIQHHWSCVGSTWQIEEEKAAKRRILECLLRSLENCPWRLLEEITRQLVLNQKITFKLIRIVQANFPHTFSFFSHLYIIQQITAPFFFSFLTKILYINEQWLMTFAQQSILTFLFDIKLSHVWNTAWLCIYPWRESN